MRPFLVILYSPGNTVRQYVLLPAETEEEAWDAIVPSKSLLDVDGKYSAYDVIDVIGEESLKTASVKLAQLTASQQAD